VGQPTVTVVVAQVTRLFDGSETRRCPVAPGETRFELVINLKTAKGLGLTIPPSVYWPGRTR